MNKTTKIRRVTVGVLVLAVVATLTACATRAPSDSIILYYAAGAGENREFQECIEPGTDGSYPVDDEIFALPTSLRTWNIRPEGGDSDQPIVSGTLPTDNQPGAEVAVFATADFYINSDCAKGKDSPVVKFWESTGRRYGISADGEEGFDQGAFNRMLLNTLVPAEEKALREETRKYDADSLDANLGNVWTTMERNLAPTFLRTLRDKLGGDYFCGTGYAGGKKVSWTEWEMVTEDEKGSAPVLNKEGQPTYREVERTGTCPPVRISITDVRFANKDIADSRNRVVAAENNAKADRIKAQGEADRAGILEGVGNSPGYVRLQEIEAQKAAAEACKTAPSCTVIIGDIGGAQVPVGGR
jgi:hypothetical protein